METKIRFRIILLLLVAILSVNKVGAVTIPLWVGQSYTWDFSGAVMGSTYNLSVSSNGGYLSITGSGFYRTITPTQYFSGTATVTAEWDYTLYYGDTKKHQKVSITISCNENPVSIIPTSVTLSPGETYQLGYRHQYDNQYVGAANVYFSGGNSSFSVTSSGLITAESPGTGYVTVYSKLSSAANAPSCFVTVREIEPTGATIGNISILADESQDLTVTVSPSNASVKSTQWFVKSGSDVVSITGQRITGLKPGTASIYCMVNGSVRSNDATVTVTEPNLFKSSTTPANDATNVSVFVVPAVTYSHTLYKGDGFSSIKLSANGADIAGVAELSNKTVRFIPNKPLSAQTSYQLFIPRNAVKNKWGSPAQSDVTLSFKTGALEKATVTMTPVSGSYLGKNDYVTLTSTPGDAKIYYTLDGTNPTTSSLSYSGPIKSNGDFTVKAFAVKEGYEDSDIAVAQYYQSQSEIVGFYPNDSNPLFNYAFVAPHLKLSGGVEKSNNFRRISLTDGLGNTISGQTFITNYLVIFVPDEPLRNSTKYTMDIPRDALKTTNGEVFKGFQWTFTTPTQPISVAMQGDESVFVLFEDGTLKTRGMDFLSTAQDGSFTFKDYKTLSDLLTGVDEIDGGFTHKLIRKGSTATGYGMALCGETGNNSSINEIGSIKTVRAGFQTSAIIGTDNSLWMCGRNDFYQLGDNIGSNSKTFVKVAENVIDVALGNGYTLFVDTDNVLWAVGRNNKGQLGDGTKENRRLPVKIMEGVSKVFASASGFFSACITVDEQLLTWGDNSLGQLGREGGNYSTTPEPVLENILLASLGEGHSLALTDGYKLYAWGSDAYGQIGLSGNKVTTPTLMAENVLSVCAGPKTSLVLDNSGRVRGWGRCSHNNLGADGGNASAFAVYDGSPYATLERVTIEPSRFEIEPESSGAFVAMPYPFASDYESVEWTSDHPEIANIDGNGIFHTGDMGEAVITVKFTDRFGISKTAEAKVICTDNPDNSGIKDNIANSKEWYAYTNGKTIIIENVTEGEIYSAYNVEGLMIDSVRADAQRITLTVNQTGVYLIRSNSKVIKVVCH